MIVANLRGRKPVVIIIIVFHRQIHMGFAGGGRRR